MVLSKRPNLLVLEDLLRPVTATAAVLSEIAGEAKSRRSPDVVRHGLFVMAVASVETMISDTLKYYLSVIPQKLDTDDLKVMKDDLLTHQYDLIEIQIERRLYALFYKRIDDILKYFCTTLSLHVDSRTLSAPLREIKATRNILLHNNRVVNSAYLESAGNTRRATKVGETLNIDQAYLATSVNRLVVLVEEMRRLIFNKYARHTRLAAIKRLWAFTFQSPVMPFEDFWTIDKKADRIGLRKKGKYEDGISASEMVLLSVWRTHFNPYAKDLLPLNMRAVQEDVQAKVLYLLSVFRYFELGR